MAMEISSVYNSYTSTYTNGTDSKKQTESKAATKTGKANSSSAAKAGTSDYLAELQKKNPKLNLLTGYSNGTPGSSNYPEKINVTIAPEFLAKMEADPKLAAEYEKNLADIPAACKWGESIIRSMTGNSVYEFRFYIDENGNMSAGSVSGPREKNSMMESVAKQVKMEQEKFYKAHGTPDYRKDAAEIRESLVNKSASGKTSIGLNREANSDIYKMFSNLDVSSKENFVNSFTKAVESFKNHYAGGEVQIFTGTGKERSQLDNW